MFGAIVGDPVALPDAERLQGARPAVAAVEELLVGEPQVAVDDGLAGTVQAAGAAGELKRRQRCFHRTASCQAAAIRDTPAPRAPRGIVT